MSDRRHRILVVDDTPAHLATLADALRADYDLALASGGQDALAIAFSDDPPDLVLLDVLMPEMDGYEVCRRLKADEATREIPVIFITALSETEDEALGLNLGAIDYLAKPVNPSLVKARVRNHLALRQAARLREDVERITRHDLKNPLTVVISMPQVLARAENVTARQRLMLHQVEEAGYTMLRMINFSLDLFRIEMGLYRYRPGVLDLGAVCQRVFAELGELARSGGVSLELTVGGRPAEPGQQFKVRGEELLCHTMLGNLVRNGVEASPRGAVVGVDLSGEDPVRIAVHNQGAVPQAVRARFFAKYATHGKERGTGLGTYSARLTAQVMGGSIGYETSEEAGTTVTVTVPGLQPDQAEKYV